MNNTVTVALAQLDLIVGDVKGNTARILESAEKARDELRADLVVFPELSICGYPPEDLLFHAGLRHAVERSLEEIRASVSGIAVLVGFPEYQGEEIFNSCAVIADGKYLCHYRKRCLPNYAVFDEERYFTAGKSASVFKLNGIRIGLNICEDIWRQAPITASRAAGAEVIVAINGSPYQARSQENRERAAAARADESGIPIVYLNMVGGQDELVFDGGSFAISAGGDIRFRAPPFEEGLYRLVLRASGSGVEIEQDEVAEPLPLEASVYRALVTGTRDYVRKHKFPGVIIGLSGGIDSALVTAIACDAIGADKVRTVMMPFRYTSTISQEDAARQAETMGFRYDIVPIAPIYDATVKQLESIFAGREPDVTILMAISNKTGRMLLTTGNKSEMAVGYATLYGDMAGGFAPIKDCSKTLVYRLARYRNTLGEAIPERAITREPSAELRPGQKDSDSLPDYAVLDPILEAFIEKDMSVDEITGLGFDRATVIRVLQMVKHNEYKRRQAPPGIRISSRAFGRDWRYPITSWYPFPG
jgi:NAD+ synthase (glutamine-hydrolysing)